MRHGDKVTHIVLLNLLVQCHCESGVRRGIEGRSNVERVMDRPQSKERSGM